MLVPFLAILGAQATSPGPQTPVSTRPLVYHSLEAMIGPGERVFVGSITRLETDAVIVEVRDELRGRGARTISLPRHPDDPRDKGYARYAAGHAPYLLAVGPGVSGGWLALRLGESAPEERRPDFTMTTIQTPDPKGGFPHVEVKGTDPEKVFDDSMALPVLSMDLRLLSTPTQVIEWARWFLKTTPVTVKTDPFPLPMRIPAEIGPTAPQWGPFGAILDIPKTAAEEALVQRIVRNPKEFLPIRGPHGEGVAQHGDSDLPPKDLLEFQALGIFMLSDYKSKPNRALLMRFLDDPNYEDEKDKAGGSTKRAYPLREAAHQVLQKWDREEAPPPAPLPEPKPGLFALVGVGTGADEGFATWGPDGKPSKGMSDFFAFARKRDSSHAGGMKLPDIDNYFKTDPKARTRYVAVRMPNHLSTFWTDGPIHFDTLQVGRGGQYVAFFRFVAPPGKREIPFTMEMWSAGAASVRVPIETGAKASGGGVAFEVGAIAPVARPADLIPDSRVDMWSSRVVKPEHRLWTVELVQTGALDALKAGNVLFQPLDRSGRPIKYVGSSGEPVDVKEAALVEKEGEFEHPDDKLAFAITVPEKPGLGTYKIATNVDPKAHGSVAVWLVVHRRQDFGSIPLEPAGGAKP